MASYEWTQGNSAGPYTTAVSKVVLHTTEGGTIEGACAAYETSNSWPHVTVDCRFGKGYRVCGHLGYDVAARSLKNKSGGVETNTAGCIQIEVVGYATKPEEIDWAWLGAEIIGPMCRDFGIPVESSVRWVAYPDSYGEKAPQRLFGQDWLAYSGILGHQHVPENSHGDPGLIPINSLLNAAQQEDDMPLVQSDLNAIESVVRKVHKDFERLPVIWANQTRPTHWYVVWHPFKVLVDQTEAASLVANSLAEYPGTTASQPNGTGQAAVVPDNILALFQTVGPDEYTP